MAKIDIIQGDCLEIMKSFENNQFDLILTDPPYDRDTHVGGKFYTDMKFGNVSFGAIDIVPVINEFLRISARWVVVFVPVETLGLIKESYRDSYIRGGIWDRIVNSPQISGDRPAQAVEGIAILHKPGKKKWNGGGKAGIWRGMLEARGKKLHDTQKPIEVIRQLVSDFSDLGDTVLDPFLGSGTTAVACERMGRNCFGIEINENHCATARKRVQQEKDKYALLSMQES